MNEAMWHTGRSAVLLMLKGMTVGEWLCTTAFTSERTR